MVTAGRRAMQSSDLVRLVLWSRSFERSLARLVDAMDRLFKSMLSVRELKFRMDDDYVDRLSRQHTVIILVCFGFLVSTKQFVGRPINCWCPAQFTDSHRDYSDAICWVSNTYYLPIEQTIPEERFDVTKNRQLISYYQWVPLILLFQVVQSFLSRK